MYTKTEKIVYRASYCVDFSAKSPRVSFSTATRFISYRDCAVVPVKGRSQHSPASREFLDCLSNQMRLI
jgi:hypothetical protein